ncbi:Ricin B lectin [Nosema bombycis CQ1]|uniref:Ricin B lectin n=1 Tax=Nosema bombycis (strain CQ1 / CVCC 102059) TaxID=578461 RepID=R0KQ41_NOSB1|nr:Ricin B lectin [Nosema bombycis CQ1]WGJ64400.1 ricin B lectin-like protein [Nosema bombycis]|eukprot:EOB12322.1 Ricin B lectin [Nosema bombycis CQ1]
MLVFIILTLSIAKGLLIRHRASNAYLSPVAGSGSTSMGLTNDTAAAGDVIIEPSHDGYVFIKDSKNTGRSFDISNNKTQLILYGFHGKKNQQFYLTLKGYNEFNIMNKNLCIENVSSSSNMFLKTCNNSENQIFEFVDPSRNYDVHYHGETATGANGYLHDSSHSHYDLLPRGSSSIYKTYSTSPSRVVRSYTRGTVSRLGVNTY